ncbi:adenylosuccinate lyase [Myxococcota bacterium]|nr:adenylosuccinate lyase [Myxococcota bacterium]
MIPRYTRPEMAAIWTEEARLRVMLEVEVLAVEAMAARGEVPLEAASAVRERADFDLDRVHELDRELKHDVIAFLTAVAEKVGEPARFVHKGMTSSDVLDTAFAVQLVRAGELILTGVDRVMAAVRARAFEHKDTVCIGRSHGIHAEPTTFGLKLAGWYDELSRHRARIVGAVRDVAVGKLSGAVGTYAFVHPDVEARVCAALGLAPAKAATQVVSRDLHAAYFTALALLASSVEKFAVEVRHLQRTEVLEAEEPFTPGQKGSSAMPHKRNPILSENLTGLARLVRSYSIAAMEDVALWHERDISHSSVERVIAPDATILVDFMLHRLGGLVEGLVVYPENMRRNLGLLGGIFYSQRVLLALVEKGASREDAYRAVQAAAMRVWAERVPFRQAIEEDPALAGRFEPPELDALFDPSAYVAHRDEVFRRVFDGASD